MDQDDEVSRLVDAIGELSFRTMGVLTEIAADEGVSLTQLRVLAILRDRRVRIGELAQYLGLERSTMTGLVARASAKGLLSRQANPDDARAVDVLITDDGARVARRLETSMREALEPLTTALDPDQQSQLRVLLDAILH
ncbi:MarR family transcriptional regulator [Curtobacterium sp. RHCJP20]|uniref:MarR family transcriptional regulator n=1 Tax=Curtobacterium subtropicum TaxID=3055138 RepID=A0ABT7TEK8_9MICO|nr:MarR family transcriptional regulator [Curtobacterium subtropicum]MDM7888023.1 MarR family transcriptional regulator [Curtobacterium subtropicum]